jgi:hypothetical protein
MTIPAASEYTSEEELLGKPIRYSLDLEPGEYAGLCDLINRQRRRGAKVSMRALIRAAIHQAYPETLTATVR